MGSTSMEQAAAGVEDHSLAVAGCCTATRSHSSNDIHRCHTSIHQIQAVVCTHHAQAAPPMVCRRKKAYWEAADADWGGVRTEASSANVNSHSMLMTMMTDLREVHQLRPHSGDRWTRVLRDGEAGRLLAGASSYRRCGRSRTRLLSVFPLFYWLAVAVAVGLRRLNPESGQSRLSRESVQVQVLDCAN